jgi:hypothetical protein
MFNRSISKGMRHKILVTMGLILLVHDWVYWETGKVTFEARRQIVQNRLAPASVAIILGAIALMLWKLLK